MSSTKNQPPPGDTSSFQAPAPCVASVMVTYNPDPRALADLLRSHLATGVHHIFLVDNGSYNQRQLFGILAEVDTCRVELLAQQTNLGVAAAQNLGISLALEQGFSHVVLFDQDTRPPVQLLGCLLAEEARLVASGHNVAAIGPSCYDGRTGSAYCQMRIQGPLLKKVRLVPGSQPVRVSFLIASGSLIRCAVMRHVGLMDENLFIDRVDLEWCLRAEAKGYDCFISTRVEMLHQIGDRRIRCLGREISIHSPLRRYYMARNAILLARLPWVPLGYSLRELFGLVVRTPYFLLAVRFSWHYLRCIAMGVLHGLAGRGGEYQP